MVFGKSIIQFSAILSSVFFNMLLDHVSWFSVCDLSPRVLRRYCCLDPSLLTCLKLIFHRVSRFGFVWVWSSWTGLEGHTHKFGVINSWWIHIWLFLHLNIVDLKHVHLLHMLLRVNAVADKLNTIACLLPSHNEMEEDKRKNKTTTTTKKGRLGGQDKINKQKTYLIREW